MDIAIYAVVTTFFTASFLMARKRLTKRPISALLTVEYLVGPILLIGGTQWLLIISDTSAEWTAGLLGATALLFGLALFSFGPAALLLVFAFGAILTAGNALYEVLAWFNPKRMLLVITALLCGDVAAFLMHWLAAKKRAGLAENES